MQGGCAANKALTKILNLNILAMKIYTNPKFNQTNQPINKIDKKQFLKAAVGLFLWVCLMAVIWFFLLPISY